MGVRIKKWNGPEIGNEKVLPDKTNYRVDSVCGSISSSDAIIILPLLYCWPDDVAALVCVSGKSTRPINYAVGTYGAGEMEIG